MTPLLLLAGSRRQLTFGMPSPREEVVCLRKADRLSFCYKAVCILSAC